MGKIDQRFVQEQFLRADQAATTTEQGRLLEDLVCLLFETVPGISITVRNTMNVFETEEVDIAFWNQRRRRQFDFLPHIILVECKNWSRPVGSQEVAYFITQLRDSGEKFGVLVAAKGVTGSSQDLTAARFHIASALKEGIRVVVIDREEIEQLTHSDQLIELIQTKLSMLAVRRACF